MPQQFFLSVFLFPYCSPFPSLSLFSSLSVVCHELLLRKKTQLEWTSCAGQQFLLAPMQIWVIPARLINIKHTLTVSLTNTHAHTHTLIIRAVGKRSWNRKLQMWCRVSPFPEFLLNFWLGTKRVERLQSAIWVELSCVESLLLLLLPSAFCAPFNNLMTTTNWGKLQ